MTSFEPVNVPRPRKSVIFGLIVLSIFFPWLALWLDGASWPTIGCNFAAWILFPFVGTLGATIHAIICLCRSKEHRTYSTPARRRLRYDNKYSANAETKFPTEKNIVHPEPNTKSAPVPVTRVITEQPTAKTSATSSSTSVTEPAPAPVERAITDPAPGPVTRAVTEPAPAPVERAATEPPAAKSSAASSTTSVSSSDVEDGNPPADGPPPRTATAKKEDDPFKDPNA